MDSGVSSEKSGDVSDAVHNKISKESANLDFSNGSVKDKSFDPKKEVISNGSCRSRPDEDNNNMDIGEPRSRRSVWASNWRYKDGHHKEGSSSYHNNAPQYAELDQNTNDLDVNDVQAELLRKLDELKIEIVRSRNSSRTHQQNQPMMANLNQVQVFRSQNHGRNPVMPIEPNPYHKYYSGSYISNVIAHNQLFHHPSCSCLACYSKHHQAPPPPSDPVFYHHDFNRRFSNLSMNSHSSEPKTRWYSEIRRPPRGILTTGVRLCRPVNGGSPFIACCTCFELLQVPKMKTKKMRCAACSSVMLLSVVNKRLVLSVCAETDNGPEKSKYDHKILGDAKSGGTDFSSEDFNDSGNFDFESVDKLPHRGPSLTSYKSALSYASEDEIKVNIILDENPVDVALNDNKPSPPPSGSPLQDHFDYSTKYNRAGKGNVSRRSEMERAENPVNLGHTKEVADASEIEILSNEYRVNTGSSLESRDTSRETDQKRSNESYFVGVIKKSSRELSRSGQYVDQGEVNVTVNGHPIPDRLVKKAEKLAGTVQPGDYWYDPKAGFWGMMGGPCRGIIMPFIEEFNHPMPEKCGDGNTTVFVNGRELHQKDLELLVSRGLPTDADRSYMIDISGNVFDEDSGLKLQGLGKLAPTVERKKQGFGMKPPRTN